MYADSRTGIKCGLFIDNNYTSNKQNMNKMKERKLFHEETVANASSVYIKSPEALD